MLVTIHFAGGEEMTIVNQRKDPVSKGGYHLLGTDDFKASGHRRICHHRLNPVGLKGLVSLHLTNKAQTFK